MKQSRLSTKINYFIKLNCVKFFFLMMVMVMAGFSVIPNFSFADISDLPSPSEAEKTQALIDFFQKHLANLQNDSSRWCYNFDNNLNTGDENNDVYNLQIALQKDGFDTGIIETNEQEPTAYFDEKLASLVSGFQMKYKYEILIPNNLQYGNGFVGQSTRDKLNYLYGCKETDITATDSDNSPDYTHINDPLPITPEKNPDLFITGVGKGTYAGGSVSCLYGVEPDPTSCKSTSDNFTIFYDHCSSEKSLNEAYIESDGRLGANGVFAPEGYICEAGRFVPITTSITILSPNGGEMFEAGESYWIKWTPYGDKPTYVGLNLLRENNSVLGIGNVPNTGSYEWTIPPDFLGNSNFKIEIFGDGVVDESDAPFTISAQHQPFIYSLVPGEITYGNPVYIQGFHFEKDSFVVLDAESGNWVNIKPFSLTPNTISFVIPLGVSLGSHTVSVKQTDTNIPLSNSFSLEVASSSSPRLSYSTSSAVTNDWKTYFRKFLELFNFTK